MARRKTANPARPWYVRVLRYTLFAGLAGLVALAIAVGVAWSTLPSYEELKQSPNGQMIRVHAADGTVIISLGPSFGAWLPYSAIPKVMTDAMVSVEDRRYRWHPGVDPLGIARSMIVRVEKGHFTQGGSTITQ